MAPLVPPVARWLAMNPSLRLRLALYVLALTLTLALSVATAVTTWRKRNYWERQARVFQIESITTAEEYKASFLELNLRLLRYEVAGAEAAKARAAADAAALARWLQERVDKSTIPETRALLREI